MLRWTSIRF
ncbi:hypothetical protein LINPERHAP2_LOCUS553 [Linum perenne]